MKEKIQELTQAFSDYREDLEKFERKKKPAAGLFGIGQTLQQDGCHERLDERVEQITAGMAALNPAPEDAERAVRMLLFPEGEWPLAAEWMLRALERHTLPLIPFLEKEAAAAIQKEYAGRYPRWDRLPAQKKVFSALKNKA